MKVLCGCFMVFVCELFGSSLSHLSSLSVGCTCFHFYFYFFWQQRYLFQRKFQVNTHTWQAAESVSLWFGVVCLQARSRRFTGRLQCSKSTRISCQWSVMMNVNRESKHPDQPRKVRTQQLLLRTFNEISLTECDA